MGKQARALIVGGTAGIGRAIAVALARRGEQVVITGRSAERTSAIASEIGFGVTGIALDLTRPLDIAAALAGLEQVDHLVLSAIERDQNSVRNYDVARALNLVTMKLVGYTEVVHTLLPRLGPAASIVLLGGQAKNRPYPGSVTVTTVNGGVESMVRALAVELAPIRVNALHPGVVSDTGAWRDKPQVLEPLRAATPTGHLATTSDVADATLFLLDNPAINGVNIDLEGGRLLK